MFPCVESLEKFKKDCDKNEKGKEVIDSIINYAYQENIIEKKEYFELEQFVAKNSLSLENKILKDTFTELLDNIDKELGIKSVAFLVKEINKILNKCKIKLNIKNRAKFTLLKKDSHDTPDKRNTLRAMAFWVGYEKSDLKTSYNYEILLNLFKNQKKLWNEKEGCRIAFALYSRGDDINIKMIEWIKDQIKFYMNKQYERYSFKPIKTDNITISYVDLFQEQQFENELNNPISYGKCINNAISLAYQIYIKWALSVFGSKQIILSIGIGAGEFEIINSHVKAILEEKLPDNPVIRISNYTRQCILMNEIRVVICNNPKEKEIFNGEIINIWWIVGLWNTIYWDFVPEMSNNKLLMSNEKLIDLLWNPENKNIHVNKDSNVITTMLKFPHNTLLGLEIAKTLFYRQKYFEANEIVRIILSRDPKNLIARSLRMSIYWNQGIVSETYSKSDMYFRNAEEEANYIEEYCDFKTDDYYCERGLGKLAHAMTIFRTLRHNKGNYKNFDIELNKDMSLNLLKEAENIFEKGMAVSPIGSRPLYLLLCTRSFRRILSNNEKYFLNPNLLIVDSDNIFKYTGEELFHFMGWLRNDFSEDRKYEFLGKILDKAIKTHSNSNFLKAFIPNAMFCYAVLIWDFSPFITTDIINKTLNWLYEAKQLTKELKQDIFCVYSSIRFNAEIMKSEIFIEHLDRIINEIEKRKKDDNKLMAKNSLSELKLSLVNI